MRHTVEEVRCGTQEITKSITALTQKDVSRKDKAMVCLPTYHSTYHRYHLCKNTPMGSGVALSKQRECESQRLSDTQSVVARAHRALQTQADTH